MSADIAFVTLTCTACSHRGKVGGDLLGRLLKVLPIYSDKRTKSIPPTIHNVLCLYDRFTCSECGEKNVVVEDDQGRTLVHPDHISRCNSCHMPIPQLRIEASGSHDTCFRCQGRDDMFTRPDGTALIK